MKNTTLTTRQALYAQETEKVFLVCLTIDHPDLATPIKVVNNSENVTRIYNNIFSSALYPSTKPWNTTDGFNDGDNQQSDGFWRMDKDGPTMPNDYIVQYGMFEIEPDGTQRMTFHFQHNNVTNFDCRFLTGPTAQWTQYHNVTPTITTVQGSIKKCVADWDSSDDLINHKFLRAFDIEWIGTNTLTYFDLNHVVVGTLGTYLAYPFEISLPTDTEEQSPRATLRIDNVDRLLVQTIRTITTPATVKIEVVRADDPDFVEAEFPAFTMTNIRYDAFTIEADLSLEDFLFEPYPAKVFSPADFPGMF